MSFLKTKKLIATLSFASMIAMPFMVSAQSWTPPAGAPPDNNTYAPINVSSNEQTKEGGLKINQYLQVNKNATLFGQTVLRPDVLGLGFFANFLKSSFYDTVNLGDASDAINPVAINTNIFGQLNYKMADDNGNIISPVSGYVLSTDGQGNASWVDPATVGVGGGGAGNLLPGTADGQTLRWNLGTSKWEPTSKILIGGSTTTIDNTNVALGTPNTNNLFITTGTNPGSKITLTSPGLKIPLGNTAGANKILVSTDAQGDVAWVTPASIGIGGGGGSLPAGETGDTLWYDGSAWLNTNKLQWNGTGDSLKFNGDDFILAGNNGSLNAAIGRFLYSTDAQGKVSWNKNLIYEDAPINGGITLNKVHVVDGDNDSNTVPVFQNDGITVLNGSTLANGKVTINNADEQITGDGALYIEHLDHPTAAELSTVKPVCYVPATGKITQCQGLTDIAGGHIVDGNNNTATLTFYPADNGHDYTFDFSGNVGLKWCGGGGGGGGGGIGGPLGGGAMGGAGGGGGEKASCQNINSVHVNPGDVLTWSIGEGGIGGYGAAYDDQWHDGDGSVTVNQHGPANGSAGNPTSVYLNGSQQGSTQLGGQGGRFGQSTSDANCSANNGQIFTCGGLNGNFSLATGSQAEQTYFNGQGGQFNGNGAKGGAGDTSAGMSIPVGGPGYPGGAGIGGDLSTSIVHGGNGKAGPYGEGGGGGGGSFAVPQLFIYSSGGLFGGSITGMEHMLNGGNGGKGGDGFLTITGLPVAPQVAPTEIVYDTPGTYTLIPGTLPGNAQHLNIEVWGAGGGGGGSTGATPPNGTAGGGGGGSGSYGRLENFPRPTGSVTIVVGGGGAAGANGTNPTAGGTGGQSKYGTVIVAPGGGGGQVGSNNNPGNAGNGASTATGATQNVVGTGGSDGTNATGGAGAPGHQGVGSGGTGGYGYSLNQSSATAGGAGKVRITWN